MYKKAGLKNALGGVTCSEFVWHKDKKGNKIIDGGVEDGRPSGHSCDEMGGPGNAEKNKRIREEVGHIYFKPK